MRNIKKAIKRVVFISLCILSTIIYNNSAFATDVTCTYTGDMGEVGKDYAIPPANVTLSGNIPDFTYLYTFTFVMLGYVRDVSCNPAGYTRSMTIDAVPGGKQPISWGGYIIYPTSVEGLGISLRNRDLTNVNVNIPLYPTVLPVGGGVNNGGWTDMRLWKIPGNLPTTNGVINFTGPTYHQVYHYPAGYNLVNTNMSYSPAGSTLDWTVVSRKFVGSMTLLNGTCELKTGNKTVQLGAIEETINSSPWKDASFTLKCPNAYGYAGAVGNTTAAYNQYNANSGSVLANTEKNANLKVTIVPRTSVVTANGLTGTIALNGGGAEGYGVQLAWGDYSTQALGQPAKPVIFNTPILASQLNAAFPTGSYNYGAAMPQAEIKMAARLIRTTGNTVPGQALTSVEVIANYN